MVNVALVQDNAVTNVAVFDDTIWDFETWDRFQADHDELIIFDGTEQAGIWIGWTRPAADQPFVAPLPDDGG